MSFNEQASGTTVRLDTNNTALTPAAHQPMQQTGILESDGSVSAQVRLFTSDNVVVTEATLDANMGTVATGTTQPAGGAGILGLLSGLFNNIGTVASSTAQPSGGAGFMGLLSGIYNAITSALNVSVTGKTSSVSVTPTITAGAYSVGQAIGGVMTFANVFGTPKSGVLYDLIVTSKSAQGGNTVLGSMQAHVFTSNPTAGTYTDHGTAAIATGDVGFLNKVYTLNNPYSGLGTHTIWSKAMQDRIVGSTQNLYVVLVAMNAMTFASTSDITVSLVTAQD